jgi:aspartyl protease family protein
MSPRSFGTGMIVAACVLGMVVLTLIFGDQIHRRDNPNSDPESIASDGVTAVTLRQNRAGHYVARGAINGEPVDFLLDTGATDVVVPATLAQELGLEPGARGRAMTANGPVTVYLTRIPHLSIGDIHLYDVRASINPAMGDMDILLGMSALRQVEFIQSGRSLTLRKRDP